MLSRSLMWLGCVSLLGMLVPARAGARSIEVSGPRVHMGDLVTDLPEPWASLDMGASPEPMQEARYTQDDIEARLHKAHMRLPQDVQLPRVLRVVRAGQIISEPRLASLVRQSLISQLPPGSRIRSLRLSGGVALPSGLIDIRSELPDILDSGEQILRVSVAARSDKRAASAVSLEAYVDLDVHAHRSRVPVLSRGSEVTVQVRTQGVLVQGSGLAQEPGSIGDYIKVLPNQGSRMVQARIVDARTVEVRL